MGVAPRVFLRRLKLERLLSFQETTVELGPLNVLIGANGVGKSNLIEAISLLQSTPTNLQAAIVRGGGIRSWLSLLGPGASQIAKLGCLISLQQSPESIDLNYEIEFSEDASGLVVLGESLMGQDHSHFYFERTSGGAIDSRDGMVFDSNSIKRTQSFLERFKLPGDKTPITAVGRQFEAIRVFRELRTSANSGARAGINTSAPKEFLSEAGDNLALILNEFHVRGLDSRIREYLQGFSDRIQDVRVGINAGIAQLSFVESNLIEQLSGVRISDGTLKFLCILAILLHPEPPPLVCLEEPELGLHPDAMQILADVLVEASNKTQIVFTTHSEALVSALSDRPDSILVCERDSNNGTQFRRLSREGLEEWLQDYSLGDLWRRGEIGGVRW